MIKCEIIGTLIEKSSPVQISDKLTKSEIVVETSGKYPDFIKIEVVNEDIKKLEGIPSLQEVKVTAYLQGRRYTDKKTNQLRYFNSVKLISIGRNTQIENPIVEEEPMF